MDVCLDDIRSKLKDFDDSELALSILDYLNSSSDREKELASTNKKLEERVNNLLIANGALMSRVVSVNESTPPDNTIDEEAIIKEFSKR